MGDAQAFQQAFGTLLAGGDMIADPALRRALAIHRNSSSRAAQEALAANYPVIRALVGADAFTGCAGAYVEVRPPRDPRLCFYGADFPAFIATWPPFADLPYLLAIAIVERMVIETLFAADAAPMDAAAFARAPDPARALILHPAARLASFDCPAASLWQAHQRDAPVMLETIPWQAETLLLTRPGRAVEARSIDIATHAFLKAPTLGAAATAAAALGGDVAAIFAAVLMAGALA